MTSFSHPPIKRSENPVDATFEEDAGIRAATTMRNKRTAMQKAKFMFKLIVWLSILAVLAAIAGVVYYGYKTREFRYVISEVKCSVQLTSAEKLEGTRTYGQRQFTYFGTWQVIDKSEVSEQTRVDVRGYSLTVVGTNTLEAGSETGKNQFRIGDTNRYYWTKNAGQGEQGTLMLDPATTYTFMVDKKGVAVVDYATFCH